ncbi:venom carboxylesterase-6-like isoform X1 [Diabrotica virgifera virgifera]|uniref:Carboxylic ester hydrolase n=1 Tax=Diabrotica virgifera virgifera TaxID=50390 RepID=A0ABM5IZS5_DIAVI|nr:venom carboxylesterase-6-like isoform X1 [Diabrotica virgifera virgifera]
MFLNLCGILTKFSINQNNWMKDFYSHFCMQFYFRNVNMVLKNGLVVFLLSAAFKVNAADNGPEVQTPLGRVRGVYKKSFEGYPYSSFEGIPYAKPPINELRFEEPVPVEPWNEVIDATKSSACPQRDLKGLGPVIGEEDCLYLNIYVPGEVNTKNSYDIHFLIHGGALMNGSGQMASDSFMMDNQNVIFVSFNYRLGPLGFLSTEDNEVPGNNGMKDQVMALKWLRDNIHSFGGNPQSITISGFSAGGSCVHLLYLSPWSKDLFIRGISNSGSAISPWFLKEKPLIFAQKLAADVGCPTSPTSALKACLKEKPANLLMEQIENFMEYVHLPISPFGVVIDTWANNPFLPEHPYSLLERGKILDLPWIVSVNRDEGIFPSGYFCTDQEAINRDFLDKAHLLLDYNYTYPEKDRKIFAKKIRDFYFGQNDISEENFDKLTQMFGDRLFKSGIEISAKLQASANKESVYVYFFNYDESINKLADFFCPEMKVSGIAHCQDTVFAYGCFLFHELAENDKHMKKIFNIFMNSFISKGKPFISENLEWLPTKGNNLSFMNITNVDNIKMDTAASLYPTDIWSELNKSEFQN